MNPSDLCIPLRKSLPALFECSMTPGGAIRVRTPFVMSDGDLIDVFVEKRDDGYLLTDYGEALGWAVDAIIKREADIKPESHGR